MLEKWKLNSKLNIKLWLLAFYLVESITVKGRKHWSHWQYCHLPTYSIYKYLCTSNLIRPSYQIRAKIYQKWFFSQIIPNSSLLREEHIFWWHNFNLYFLFLWSFNWIPLCWIIYSKNIIQFSRGEICVANLKAPLRMVQVWVVNMGHL